ncbi:MAG: DNA topoisomerase 3 [Paludibacteraceae bacterium]|nr:DNA topoisomerase 3 [Paludibacteraceae bacterium]
MIVCIAEKPSVGRDIARILGANERRDGYMEGNGYQVTWTFGHLCTLLEPQDYSPQWRGWNMSSLPMIPERFGIKVMDDQGVKKQFETIRRLMLAADMIVNCGDAGQEGELIQRWVMQKVGVKCPVQRLWINSLTDEAIREGFQGLKDQSEYRHLYEAGLMRAIGDWLLGMNCTRAYTLKYQNSQRNNITTAGKSQDRQRQQPLSVGRVQTPTLALIVNRQREITRFVPRTYWELQTDYRGVVFKAVVKKSEEELLADIQKLQEAEEKKTAKNKEQGGKTKDIPTLSELQAKNTGIEPIENASAGAELVKRLSALPFTVTSVERKKSTEGAPRLFDLTSLQVECNKKYSFSADKTLQLIQSLYEKHATTYPRVDTTFLPDDQYSKVPAIFKGIESHFPQISRLRELMREEQQRTGKPQKLPKSKKVFDNSKVTDHHAIIPTGQAPAALSEEEKKVYNLVALRFIAAFYPDCQVATTTVTGCVKGNDSTNEVPFRTSGREVLTPGWREVFASAKSTSDNSDTSDESDGSDSSAAAGSTTLPEFTKGESGAHQPSLVERQTTPPKPYTEATLLRAMETAGKLVDDDELRDLMKDNGIGRPSTRAEIIKKLFQRQYIFQKGKSLFPTPNGERLIALIQSPLLKSAELTGQWEKKLRKIERGEMDAATFLSELKQMTEEVVHEVKASKVGMVCPVCRQGYIIRGNTAYGCSRWKEGCTYREPYA